MQSLFYFLCRSTTCKEFRKNFINVAIANNLVQIQIRNLQFNIRFEIEEIAIEYKYCQL